MLTQLLDRLVDRLIQLIEHRRNRQEKLFREVLQPCLEDLEKLHQEYSGSFRRYRILLQESSRPLGENHPIFDQIHEDAVFAAGDRLNVWQRLQGFSGTIADQLILDVVNYIWFLYSPGMRADPSGNPYRSQLSRELRAVFSGTRTEAEKKRAAMRLIDGAVRLEQENYAQVVGRAAEIHRVLLEL